MVPCSAALVTVILLAGTLAGCLGDDDAPEVPTGPRVAEEARVSARTGSVTGQVITMDLEIVVDGWVRLLNASAPFATTQTDRQGRYTFNDVPSGRYTVEIAAACCQITTRAVDVLVANVAEVNVRLERLTPTGLGAPYVVQDEWEGLLGCGVSVASQPNDACAAGDANHDDEHGFEIGSGIEELVVAMTWEPAAQSLAPDMRLLIENSECSGCFQRYAYLNGPPPLIAFINDDHAERDAGHFVNITAFMDMRFEVTAGGNNIVYQQPFTLYWYEFYNQRAPEGFQPLPDA